MLEISRDKLIKLIPKPKNEDVIIYDTTLKDLIDVNVFEEYSNKLNFYKINKENYLTLNKEVKEFENFINNVYLYNRTWTDSDYLEALKSSKKTFSIRFAEIKKIENKIEILNRKYKSINEKIEIQMNKNKKELEKKRETIDESIEKNKNNILIIQLKLNELTSFLKKYNDEIKELDEDDKLITNIEKKVKKNDYKCEYCGSAVAERSTKMRVNSALKKKKEKNQKKREKYLEKIDELNEKISSFKKEISTFKIELKNNIEFKKQDYNFYLKKPIEVLKLEAERDQILFELNQTKIELNNNKTTKTAEFIELKNNIEKFEKSLENLKKIRENRTNMKEKYATLEKLKENIINVRNDLNIYIKFLDIYYKIYEQKLNDYFGTPFKFKIYKINEYDIVEILEIKYNNIEHSQLNVSMHRKFEKEFKEKYMMFC